MRNLPCEVAFDENCFLDAIEEASTSKVPLRVFTLRVEAAYAHLPFHVPPALTKVLCLHNGKKTILVEKKKARNRPPYCCLALGYQGYLNYLIQIFFL